MNIRRLFIRRRAKKLFFKHYKKRGNTPETFTNHLRILRVANGHKPFERSLASLSEYPKDAADCLEIWWLTTHKPIEDSPYYLLAQMAWAFDALHSKK